MAAFYPLPRCLFYGSRGLHRDTSNLVFLWLPIRSEVKKIVHRMPEILLATEIALRCMNRCVPKQELNLLEFSSRQMT